jgi:hypothetical protein
LDGIKLKVGFGSVNACTAVHLNGAQEYAAGIDLYVLAAHVAQLPDEDNEHPVMYCPLEHTLLQKEQALAPAVDE